MSIFQITTQGEEATITFGKTLAALLEKGDVLCLFGNLGAGKTTLIKGVAQGLKVNPKSVNSPTFVLMNIYDGKLPLYHFDLYRLDRLDEIAGLGFEEFLYGDGVAVIEWAEKLGEFTPKEYLGIHLEHKTENERVIKLLAQGKRYEKIIAQMKNKKSL